MAHIAHMGTGKDIRIETTEAFRKRVRTICIEEDMTYEELLRALVDFREEHKDLWEAFNRDDGIRRPSGGGKT